MARGTSSVLEPVGDQAVQDVPADSYRDPGFRVVKSETISVPRERAAELAAKHVELVRSPTERDFDEVRYLELADRAELGLWLPCSWAVVKYGRQLCRMNGQHSARVIVDKVQFLPPTVQIHLDTYEADGPDAMALLFRQFDARVSARSKKDVAGAYQGLVPALANLNRQKAKLAIEGVAWYERAVEGAPLPQGDSLYDLFNVDKYHPFVKWVDEVLSIKTPELAKAPVLGAMYGTMTKSVKAAAEFWTHVAKQDLEDDTDPRSVLATDLVKNKEEKDKKKVLKPIQLYLKCVKAWNAWRKGAKISSLSVNAEKGMIEISS